MLSLRIKSNIAPLTRLTERYPAESVAARTSRITEVLLMLERAIKPDTPVGAGPIHLRDSIFHRVSAAGQKVWGSIGTPLEHGEPVESGTKPHFPPIGPIQHWVQARLHIEDPKKAKSVAYAIAVTISKRGTKGKKMFKTGVDENKALAKRILAQIPADIIRRVNQ